VVGGGVSAGLWYVHTEVTPLDLLIYRLLDKLPFAALGPALGPVLGPAGA
jgi:hypothetical protein